MPKKRHKTPDKIDHLFQRNLIAEEDYRDFWDGYWKSDNRDQYVIDFLDELREEAPPKEERKPGTPTKDRIQAEQDAIAINGFVVRRRKDGRFSKRGRTYQAIRRRKQ